MKTMKPLFLALAIVAAGAGVGRAQVKAQAPPNDEQQTNRQNDERDYAALVREVFTPITDELNLTNEQEIRIVGIITAAVLESGPLMDRLDDLDDEIAGASLREPFDEAKIRQLSDQESAVMRQMIVMKARTKAKMFKVLTPEQQAIVAEQFHSRTRSEQTLGSISN